MLKLDFWNPFFSGYNECWSLRHFWKCVFYTKIHIQINAHFYSAKTAGRVLAEINYTYETPSNELVRDLSAETNPDIGHNSPENKSKCPRTKEREQRKGQIFLGSPGMVRLSLSSYIMWGFTLFLDRWSYCH